MSAHFAALTTSPVPVLLPFDVTARLRDQAEGNVADDDARYLVGLSRGEILLSRTRGL